MSLLRTYYGGTILSNDDPEGAGGNAIQDTLKMLLEKAAGKISVLSYSTVALAEAAAEAQNRLLVFPSGTHLIETDITFRIPLIFEGGILQLASGITATLNEPYFNLTGKQCFDEQGRVANEVGGVRIAESSSQNTVHVRDWGAITEEYDGASDDQEVLIQQAIDAVTYPGGSMGKVGIVEFAGGTYNCADSVFIAYDWVNYPDDWDDREFVAYREHGLCAGNRKQFVILKGSGQTILKYTGDPALTKYLIYHTGRGGTFGLIYAGEIALDCQYNCRGMYVSYHTYGLDLNGFKLYRFTQIGLELIDSFAITMHKVSFHQGRGIAIRTSNCSSSYAELTNLIFTCGQKDEYWPDPDEEVVYLNYGAHFVQTKVWERAIIVTDSGLCEWHSTLFEQNILGTSLYPAVAADEKTCTLAQHGLLAGDPIYLHLDNVATTVASATTNGFVTTDPWTTPGPANRLVYRGCSAISRADPGVFDCQNHGMAEGQWVKIISGSGSGMTELETNGPWWRLHKIDGDSFSLWSDWNNSTDTGTTKLDTSGGYSATDDSEYIVSSAALVFFGGDHSRFVNTRSEANSLGRALFISPHGNDNQAIDGLYNWTSARALCDWVVEFQDSHQMCEVTHVRGDGIEKAVVMHHTLVGTRAMIGCEFKNNRTYVTEGSTVAHVQLDGIQYLNKVDGMVTPGKEIDHGDATPSVCNAGVSQKVFVYGGMMIIAADFNSGGGGGVNITDLDSGVDGMPQAVFFKGGDAVVEHGATIVTKTGSNLTPSANDELHFRLIDSTWYEV